MKHNKNRNVEQVKNLYLVKVKKKNFVSKNILESRKKENFYWKSL